MSFAIPDTANALFTAVSGVSAQFTAMTTATEFGKTMYAFTSTTNCWIKQGSAPVASIAATSMFVAAGVTLLIDSKYGVKLAVIQDTAAGSASLTPVTFAK